MTPAQPCKFHSPISSCPPHRDAAKAIFQHGLSILFNEEGNVESIVPEKYKYLVLVEAVLAVVRDWKIEPPVEAGRRVKTTVQQSFQFEVQ